jgi:hypothetical protein
MSCLWQEYPHVFAFGFPFRCSYSAKYNHNSQFTPASRLVASLLSPVETIRIRFPFSATAGNHNHTTVASSHAESTGNPLTLWPEVNSIVIHVASVEWKCLPCLECILLYEVSINFDKLVWKPENSSNSGFSRYWTCTSLELRPGYISGISKEEKVKFLTVYNLGNPISFTWNLFSKVTFSVPVACILTRILPKTTSLLRSFLVGAT